MKSAKKGKELDISPDFFKVPKSRQKDFEKLS
jgi:hypothetical protein